MQPTKWKELISRVAKQENLDEDVLQSMSDHVFRRTKDEMRQFRQLRISVKGFFTWFYRKKEGLDKLISRIDKFIELHGRTPETVHLRNNFLARLSLEELTTLRGRIVNLLAEYEVFMKTKKEVKSKFKEDIKKKYNI